MAIVINANDGTISGISVGGLPDGTVDAGTLATDSVVTGKIADGTIANADIADLAASKLTGALPAISGASLTGFTDAQMPAGSVLQVVTATNTNTANSGFLLATNSTSYSAAALAAAITPSSSSSKIMVFISTTHHRGDTTSFTIYRGSTNLGGSTYGMLRLSGAQAYWMPIGLTHLDSPSTTSAVTYTLYARAESGTFYIGGDGDMKSNITLMEIAG